MEASAVLVVASELDSTCLIVPLRWTASRANKTSETRRIARLVKCVANV